MEPFQRLLLANQYKILALLEPNDANYYRAKERALLDGYELEYSKLDNHWGLSEEELSVEDCEFVIDILNLHRALQYSVSALPPGEQPPASKWKFEGFDGNNEGEYLGYASFLIRDQGKWHELVADPSVGCPNSHSENWPMFLRMLKAWNELGRPYQLNKQNLDTVLAARGGA